MRLSIHRGKQTNRIIGIGSILAFLLMTACATTSVEERRRQSEAYRAVGEAYLREGNYTMALKELLKAESIYTEDHILHNNLGIAHLGKGRLDLAITHFKQAVALKPDYAVGKNNLGYAYLQAGRWDDAIRTYQSITDDLLYATPHFPLASLGWAHYNKQQYVLAAEYYQKALKIQPNYETALRGLGRTYLKMGRPADAAGALEKAIKQPAGAQQAESYLMLGKAHITLGNPEKARQHLTKAIELAPHTPLAAEAERALSNL